MQKQILFLYANSELSEKDLNKTTPLKIAKKKKKKYLGINLAEERSV